MFTHFQIISHINFSVINKHVKNNIILWYFEELYDHPYRILKNYSDSVNSKVSISKYAIK